MLTAGLSGNWPGVLAKSKNDHEGFSFGGCEKALLVPIV